MPDIFISNNKKNTTTTIETKPNVQVGNNPEHEIKFNNKEAHVRVFSSFFQKPIGISFRSQEENEKVLLFLRKHFITNVSWILFAILFIILPLFFLPLIRTSISSILSESYFIIFLFFYYLILFSYIFINFITWFYNIGIVTQKRIVDIDYSDIVYHDVAETKLNLVEDVNYTQTGFIRTLFNYGDLFVQTAGGKENIEMLAIPKPGEAVKIIADLIGEGGGSG